mgnify:CR=1 FL=1
MSGRISISSYSDGVSYLQICSSSRIQYVYNLVQCVEKTHTSKQVQCVEVCNKKLQDLHNSSWYQDDLTQAPVHLYPAPFADKQ